jgi:GH24 family phage-related lysozyme (muramidase)
MAFNFDELIDALPPKPEEPPRLNLKLPGPPPGFVSMPDGTTATDLSSRNSPPHVLAGRPYAPGKVSLTGYSFNTRDTPRRRTAAEEAIVQRMSDEFWRRNLHEPLETAGIMLKQVGTGIGRTLFDGAKLVNSVPLMGAEASGHAGTRRWFLGMHNELDRWQNVLFPRFLDEPVVEKDFSVRMTARPGEEHVEHKDALKALDTMAMTPMDVVKAPGRVANDIFIGAGTLLPGKLSKPFDVAHEFYDQALKPDRPDSAGVSALDGVLEVGTWTGLGKGAKAVRQAGKGGRFAVGGRLFSGDRAPDTIFGIPVVSDERDYTEEDLEFFRKHPEAGGYYDMGEDASPDDGSGEGAPVQLDDPAEGDMSGGTDFEDLELAIRRTEELEETEADLLGGIAKRFGETGEVLDAGIAWMERQAAQTADMGVPLLSPAAKMLQPAYVGARAAIANMTSGGGKYYRPEVRDEQYFSQDALREIGRNVGTRRVEMSARPGAWEASQSVGGFSVQDGKVTDKFDVNRHYDVVPDAATSLVGSIFGRDSDPDAGKVKTEIPLDKLPRQDAKGGSAWDSVDVKGTGHVVYPAAYDSALTEEQEAKYQAWRATLPKPLQYEGDYDLRGYWLDPETVKDNVKDGQHFIDRYKKPNHPTFSVESRYATGDDARLAGTWRGDEYVPSEFVARMSPDAVYRRVEDALSIAVPFIKEHEGFREQAYKDAVGKWTVGYGQTEIRDAATGKMRPVRRGDSIAEPDAAKFVAGRVRRDAAEMYRQMPWARRAGSGAMAQLLDLAYNMGLAALTKHSPLLNRDGSAAVAGEDVDAVVFREAPTYRMAGGKALKGLANRRADGLKAFRDMLAATERRTP